MLITQQQVQQIVQIELVLTFPQLIATKLVLIIYQHVYLRELNVYILYIAPHFTPTLLEPLIKIRQAIVINW